MQVLYTILICTYFLNLFVDLAVIRYLSGMLALLLLIVSFSQADRLFQVLGIIFSVVGVSLFVYQGMDWYTLPLHIDTFVVILALFFVLPFINSIIIVGRYDHIVSQLLKTKVAHMGQLYIRSSLASYLLGTFLNIAMIPLVHEVLHKNLSRVTEKIRNMFVSQAMLRAYGLCLVWSPMEVLVAITIDITHTNYLTLLPWLLLFSAILLSVSWILGRKYRQYSLVENEQKTVTDTWEIYRKIGVMLIYLVVFVICITGVRELFAFDFLTSVTVVIVPYSLIWALMIKRMNAFYVYSLQYWQMRVSGMHIYIVLFLTLGLFISVLRETDILSHVQEPFLYLAEMPLLLFVCIQILFLGLAFAGFHPLVTMSILGEIVQPLLSVINPMSIALVLITSALSTVMAGPFNITVTLTGSLLKENPYQIAWWNIAFGFLFSGTGTLLAMLLL